ncbi:MOSC domain-containing protein [Lyngbya confervoides]|uniref:MOSC N-terminal beta barrel domain-containing protein n=1 Tax=Lyngbya confervoides BDU141951 TaxID=1574623 RepID=A0ABD4T5G3_9CYAN|nr:MOSC N-terminal beta barrel domain-containing protein [Lyngbya confervoides]MCM1983881.1 MOSC N-terminal beta barrel domain-containing protein [Lyngbya confervoides BDU141951]
MGVTATLSRIDLFPIKSLDGISVSEARVTTGGSLAMDREFALVDAEGKFVNAKRTAKIHRVRSRYQIPQRLVTLSTPELSPQTFSLDQERSQLADWFSDFFGFPITLVHNPHAGFPDDRNAPGPTVISAASLATVASWYPEVNLANLRSRFRTNLEFSGVAPFWEDALFSSPLLESGFHVGEVRMRGINPCQRCVVPTRDAQTGAVLTGFQQRFIQQRRASLPDWANRSAFNHFYRLAVNTAIAASEAGKVLRVGDVLSGEDS